jgi:DNA-binding HxlR family transcriptional regulator
MRSYGQFCPLALAAEIVGERWTPLVLRELALGAERFNEIHRGVPRMSPALLVKRLRSLEAAGILHRAADGGNIVYRLTEAGAELTPVIEGLAAWGKGWLPASLSDAHADPDLVMWDIYRSINVASLPARQTVIRFDFADQPAAKRHRWIMGSAAGAELCITDPGHEVDLFVTTDSRTLVRIWHGDLLLRRAIEEGRLLLDGPGPLRRAFPKWMSVSPLAQVPRRLDSGKPLGA